MLPRKSSRPLEPTWRRRAWRLIASAFALALCLAKADVAPSQEVDLSGVDEMMLQAQRLLRDGRPCLAAERFRAIVGEAPQAFYHYVQATAACLRGEARQDAGAEGTGDPGE